LVMYTSQNPYTTTGSKYMSAPVPQENWKPWTERQQTFSTEWVLLSAAGTLYLVLIFLREPILVGLLGFDPVPTAEYIEKNAFRLLIAGLLLRALPFAFMVACFLLPNARLVRSSLLPFSRKPALLAALFIAGASVILNTADIWPYTWRSATSSAAGWASILVESQRWGALALWGFTYSILSPFIEEIIFRVLLLRSISRALHSTRVGVLVTAGIFAAAHIGNIGSFQAAAVTNAFWAFVTGIILGLLTVKYRGWIGPALAAHVSRNTVEFSMLLVAVQIAQ
jgi:membrane protease YdiL (CAAX protease family)